MDDIRQLNVNRDYVLGQIHQTVNLQCIVENEKLDRKAIIKEFDKELNRLKNVYSKLGIKD